MNKTRFCIKTMVLFRVTLIEAGMIGITLVGIVIARRTTVEVADHVYTLLQQHRHCHCRLMDRRLGRP